MKPMLKTDLQAAEDASLALVIADRVHLAIEAFPKHFRPARGRVVDFAQKYGVSRMVARRVLEGRGVPPLRLLRNMAEDLGITTDWLLGLSDEPIGEMQTSRSVRIDIWSPAPQDASESPPPLGSVAIPRTALPGALATRRLVAVTWPNQGFQPFVSPGDLVLVQQRHSALAGAHHLIAWRNGRIEVARVESYQSHDRLVLQIFGGRTEVVERDAAVFGIDDVDPTAENLAAALDTQAAELDYAGPSAADASVDAVPPTTVPNESAAPPAVRVVGVIVGRIGFNANGTHIADFPRG